MSERGTGQFVLSIGWYQAHDAMEGLRYFKSCQGRCQHEGFAV